MSATINSGAPCVTVAELALEFGMDRSNCRKWLLKKGFEPVRIRTKDSGHQLCLALTPEDAEHARALRLADGYGDALGTPVRNRGLDA
jgi:hypothetical protein